jgi:hypothetical protein
MAKRERLSAGERNEMVDLLRLRDGDKCWLCRGTILFWPERHALLGCVTIDHLVPLGEDGTNDEWNLRLAHYKCNHVRGCLMDAAKIEEVIHALLTHPDLAHPTKWSSLAMHLAPSDWYPRCSWPRTKYQLPRKGAMSAVKPKREGPQPYVPYADRHDKVWRFRKLDGTFEVGTIDA